MSIITFLIVKNKKDVMGNIYGLLCILSLENLSFCFAFVIINLPKSKTQN